MVVVVVAVVMVGVVVVIVVADVVVSDVVVVVDTVSDVVVVVVEDVSEVVAVVDNVSEVVAVVDVSDVVAVVDISDVVAVVNSVSRVIAVLDTLFKRPAVTLLLCGCGGARVPSWTTGTVSTLGSSCPILLSFGSSTNKGEGGRNGAAPANPLPVAGIRVPKSGGGHGGSRLPAGIVLDWGMTLDKLSSEKL